jgi:stage II sporulation protein D
MPVCRARLLVAAATIVTAAACYGPRAPEPGRRAVSVPDTIRVKSQDRVVVVPFESYVVASALSEVSPVGEQAETAERIFEVQSVVARTYALAHLGRHAADGYDVCDTTHCQLYEPRRLETSRFADMARRAVRTTTHQVLTFGGRIADTVYHADCGGHTASADVVWGRAVEYLIGTNDDVPSAAHRAWEFVVPLTKLDTVLRADARTAAVGSLQQLVLTQDGSGRAQHVQVIGDGRVTVRGETFRSILARAFGERTMRSTMFTVRREGSDFKFRGSGFGHGVGLCQAGAAARARRGRAAAMILATYFPGTTLTTAAVRPADLSRGRFPGLIRSP